MKKAAQRVLMATNSWLHAQSRQSQYRYDRDKGYVCTLSALVTKSTTAHLFHVGDARVQLLRGSCMEQLTNDHRLWITRRRHHVYTVSEYVEGQTLAQWMIDNPRPELESVRAIVDQIARGLLAFHRLEMLHQDLRPANVMIDSAGSVKIIDFGATRVAGIMEMAPKTTDQDILGTVQYTAPEYFVIRNCRSSSTTCGTRTSGFSTVPGNPCWSATRCCSGSAPPLFWLLSLHYC